MIEPRSQPADAQPEVWRQLLLSTDGPAHIESLLIEIAPFLYAIGLRGGGCWWIRKGHTLRLRLSHPDPNDVDRIIASAGQHGARIHPGIYEPETYGFGGEAGILVAHRMASHDAHHLAGYLAYHRQHHHRYEVFLLLATRVMRAAGLDLEEQGDVWARVAAHRPIPDPVPITTRRAVRHLIFSGPDSASSPLAWAHTWSHAVEVAGCDLSALAATGRLTRGLRAIITNLLLFMANRHGIHSRPLATLSAAAQHIMRVMQKPPEEVSLFGVSRLVGQWSPRRIGRLLQ